MLRNGTGNIYMAEFIASELTGSVDEINTYIKEKGMKPVAKLDCLDNALVVRSLEEMTVNSTVVSVVSKVAKMISNTSLVDLRGYLSKDQLTVIVMDIIKRKSN